VRSLALALALAAGLAGCGHSDDRVNRPAAGAALGLEPGGRLAPAMIHR
jgi:hypothetical protein